MLDSRQGEVISICFTKSKIAEDLKSSGGIILGDVNVRNKELVSELKEDADFVSILTGSISTRSDFFRRLSISKSTFSESKQLKQQNQISMHIHPFDGRMLDSGDSKGQDGSFKSLLFDSSMKTRENSGTGIRYGIL
jgi:hypothetical protein